MKLNKQLLVAACVLGVAVTSRASYSVSVAGDSFSGQSVTVGTGGISGSSTFVMEIPTGFTTANFDGFAEGISVFAVSTSGVIGASVHGGADPFTTFNESDGALVTGLSDGQVLTPGTQYTLTLDWTIKTPGTYTLAGDYAIGLTEFVDNGADGPQQASGTGYDYFSLSPAGVPEPAQTVAGGMLLGCGGLVFAGRRFFKKQAA